MCVCIYIYIYIYICNPGHRVSRPRGTGSVGDSVGEGRESKGEELQEKSYKKTFCGDAGNAVVGRPQFA